MKFPRGAGRGARENRTAGRVYFHSPVAEILRPRGVGAGDISDGGRVAQGDHEGNDQDDYDGHVWDSTGGG